MSTVSSMDSEYDSLISVSRQRKQCCNFIKGNKKPLIAILVMITLGFTATLIMLYLDHEGYWDKEDPIDRVWFNQTLINTSGPAGLYPLWLAKANPIIYDAKDHVYTPNTSYYLYRSQYGKTWNMDENQHYNYSTLRTQCQLIYNFATAFNMTHNISYYYAMYHGINVLIHRFADIKNGGFYYSINETEDNMTIVDDTKDSIGHSTVLYALSTAWIVSNNAMNKEKELYIQILNKTYSIFKQHFYDSTFGGIHYNLSVDWRLSAQNVSKFQLPLMYQLEALSQLLRVAQNISDAKLKYSVCLDINMIKQDIISIFNLTCGKLLQNYSSYYILYEEYTMDWKEPLSSSYASLGNALKWSSLIASIQFLDRNCSFQFLKYGIALGYDGHKMHDLIQYEDSDPPFWTCCNAIKALYYHWNVYSEYYDTLLNIISYYQNYYYDDNYGGIYYSPSQTWKGNVSKLDYQCIDMTLFLINI